MGRIALSPHEASLVLAGYLDTKAGDDASFKLREGKGTAVGERFQVQSLGYMRDQEVDHYQTVKFKEVVDRETIEDEKGELLEFLKNPLNADITSEEAKQDRQEILDNPERFMDCIISDEVPSSVQAKEGAVEDVR